MIGHALDLRKRTTVESKPNISEHPFGEIEMHCQPQFRNGRTCLSEFGVTQIFWSGKQGCGGFLCSPCTAERKSDKDTDPSREAQVKFAESS